MSDDREIIRDLNRAAICELAIQALGESREKDCHILADLVELNILRVANSASVTLKLDNPGVSAELLKDLGTQLQRHAEAIAHVAVQCMMGVYRDTLVMATRALGNEAAEPKPH